MPGEPTRKRLIERRIWRLAYLLTGDSAGAAALVDRVLRMRPDAMKLEPGKLDRLIIMQARELPARRSAGDASPALREVGAALRALPEQPREAWVLTHMDGVDELHMSLAMDCSRSASRNHLAAAEEGMKGVAPETVEALRGKADGLDPAPIIEAHRAERRKATRRRVLTAAMAAGVATLLAAYGVLKYLV